MKNKEPEKTKEQKWEDVKYSADCRLYDNRNNNWGDRVSLDERVNNGEPYYKCNGHLTPLPNVGDVVVKTFGKGDVACMFVEVEPCGNPEDMFFGVVATLNYISEIPRIKEFIENRDETRKKFFG
jgi:hypothetical protein